MTDFDIENVEWPDGSKGPLDILYGTEGDAVEVVSVDAYRKAVEEIARLSPIEKAADVLAAAFSSPREAESFLEKTQEVQVDRLARFFHSEFSSDRIAEWDDLEPLTQRIWNTEALRAYVFMLTGANPLDESETAGSDQPGRLEGVATAPSRPSRDITPNKEDRS